MKFNTFTTYPFTADLWSPSNQDGDTGAVVFGFRETIRCRVSFDGTGRVFVSYPKELKVGWEIRNVRDKLGVLVAPTNGSTTGQTWKITSYEGILNPYGTRESIRYIGSLGEY